MNYHNTTYWQSLSIDLFSVTNSQYKDAVGRLCINNAVAPDTISKQALEFPLELLALAWVLA